MGSHVGWLWLTENEAFARRKLPSLQGVRRDACWIHPPFPFSFPLLSACARIYSRRLYLLNSRVFAGSALSEGSFSGRAGKNTTVTGQVSSVTIQVAFEPGSPGQEARPNG